MNTIKNIIFDLGGVLLDIDTTKTNAAFEQLGVTDFKNNYTLHKADALFDNLEKGIITEQAFYDGIRSISRLPLHNADIRDAWNALLLDFRTESLQYLEQLAATHRLYLLSNTNSIHHTAFHNNFTATTGRPNFDAYFTKAYYSQHIGLRKPDAAIFHFVLQDAGIEAAETLFVDDLLKNIEGAAAVGMQTHHLLAHERIEHLQL